MKGYADLAIPTSGEPGYALGAAYPGSRRLSLRLENDQGEEDDAQRSHHEVRFVNAVQHGRLLSRYDRRLLTDRAGRPGD